MAQGQTEEAAVAFRVALAIDSQNQAARAALGLALVNSGHYEEAESYLASISATNAGDGPVLFGLGEIAQSRGNSEQALALYAQARTKSWPEGSEPQRRQMTLKYADLLAQSGRKSEAVALLLSAITGNGEDAVAGKAAAEQISTIGTPGQTIEAYATLTERFPTDASIWKKLGDSLFRQNREAEALDAYRRAEDLLPSDTEVSRLVRIAEETVALDPDLPHLSPRARLDRWRSLLQRASAATEMCVPSEELTTARNVLSRRSSSLQSADREMRVAQHLWQLALPLCKGDPVLAHILGRNH